MLIFPGKRENEDVLTLISKHPVVYVKIVISFLIVIVLPIVIFLAIWLNAFPLDQYYARGLIVGIFASLVFLFGLLFTCLRWIDEEFDVFILTTDRLIDVTQISFFQRTVTSTPLEQIQDTTGIINGFFPSMFHYGNLLVQTAGSKDKDTNIFIDYISNPEAVARMILDASNQKRNGNKIQISEI
jgi:hypothetical protein